MASMGPEGRNEAGRFLQVRFNFRLFHVDADDYDVDDDDHDDDGGDDDVDMRMTI